MKRYYESFENSNCPMTSMKESPEGDWVKFSDFEKVVKALRFYAKPGAISATVEDYGQSCHLEENNDISSDCSVGAKARQTLKELEIE